MIRLLIALIGVFLIWVLFVPGLSKERKITIATIAILLSMVGLWYESSMDKPKTNVVQASQIIGCGVTASHSYRTNFDLTLCFQNTAAAGNVKRLSFSIIAQQCNNSEGCQEQQRVTRDLSIDLPATESVTLKQNLSFSELEPNLNGITWSLDIHSVKAIK